MRPRDGRPGRAGHPAMHGQSVSVADLINCRRGKCSLRQKLALGRLYDRRRPMPEAAGKNGRKRGRRDGTAAFLIQQPTRRNATLPSIVDPQETVEVEVVSAIFEFSLAFRSGRRQPIDSVCERKRPKLRRAAKIMLTTEPLRRGASRPGRQCDASASVGGRLPLSHSSAYEP